MDKQKQIEEMAKDMLEYGMEKYPTGESVFTETKLRKQFYHVFLTYAEYLINEGYRKIPENAVIVSKQVWDEHIENWDKTTKAVEERVRKETAEKFAEMVEFHSVATVDEEGVEQFTISALALKEILREDFGFTNDEICKEITEGKV